VYCPFVSVTVVLASLWLGFRMGVAVLVLLLLWLSFVSIATTDFRWGMREWSGRGRRTRQPINQTTPPARIATGRIKTAVRREEASEMAPTMVGLRKERERKREREGKGD
jgi:hypothetical protein